MSFEKERIGQRLAALRKDKGMTQAELAAASGVNITSIAKYETGLSVMGLDAAYELTAALGCTLDQLVCRSTL